LYIKFGGGGWPTGGEELPKKAEGIVQAGRGKEISDMIFYSFLEQKILVVCGGEGGNVDNQCHTCPWEKVECTQLTGGGEET